MSEAPLAVSRAAAARFLLWHQGLLDADGLPERPGGGRGPWRGELRGVGGTLTAVRRLELVQVDPVAVVAPNHHLVLRARVGGYRPGWLEALFPRRAVCEYYAHARCILPVEDLPLGAPRMKRIAERHRRKFPGIERTMATILERVRAEGPLSARHFESGKVIGFWGTPMKESSLAIDLLWDEGRLVVASRTGGERAFDLTERVVPADVVAELAESRRRPERTFERAALRELRAEGITHRVGTGQHRPVAEARRLLASQLASGTVRRVAVDGVRRAYYVLPELVPALVAMEHVRAKPRTHLLSPLDNVMWSRPRLLDLFGFEYRWEIYTPAHKRRFGAYTMPVVEGDRFVARVDARADRAEGVLRLDAVHEEPGVAFGPRRRARVDRALDDLARWLRLERTGHAARTRRTA